MPDQQYEEYWKITLEYSDINGVGFIDTLKIIVDFIDKNKGVSYSPTLYKKLQNVVFAKFPKTDMGSVRKSINQFVKLGFINFQLRSYHENAKDFLDARTSRKRRLIFSKIVYSNSSFNRSVTNDSNQREINFLIKTLTEVGKLHKKDIMALMTLGDLSKISNGYLSGDEVERVRKHAEFIGFLDRKYNQISYLLKILSQLDELCIKDDYLYFVEDAQVLFDFNIVKYGRDQYLHRIYKNQLKEESAEKLGNVECMLEKMPYPTLIASHIKPFIKASEKESYDPNNGLLLSQNMDGLFDKGYISFNNDGTIIISKYLDNKLQRHLKDYKLDSIFLEKERLQYLVYHRELFKDKLAVPIK